MSCRHVNTGGYRCSRPSLPAHRGYCRQHASLLQLPPPVPPPSQPSRRGGRGGGTCRPSTSAAAASHGASDGRRRSSSAGRTPTVEQLLARIDRLRTSSPSAESAWSEDSDHETPTLGSSRQYAGCTGDSSGAESEPEGLEPVDLLHHAGVYTAEEAALVARDKLVRQQALYIQQFSRLQHLLREGRRRYLHDLKLERQAEADASKERQLAAEAGEEDSERASNSERGSTADAVHGRSGGRGASQRNQHVAEEKLRAVWRYHRHRGVCAVLRRKAWERRADTPAPPGPRCILTEGGVRCSERCLPCSKYCLKHILNDPHQLLYVPCIGRRNLTLQQRDEEFLRNRRKARRTSTAARASGATTSRQPAPVSSRTSARASARGMNPAVAAVLAARGRAITANRAVTVSRTAVAKSRSAASNAKEMTGRAPAPTPAPRNRDAATRPVAAKAEAASSSRGPAPDVAAGTARRAHKKPINVDRLQKKLNTEKAAKVVAAVKNKDADALAAALNVEKTPHLEKIIKRRTLAKMAAAIEKQDAAAVLAAKMAGSSSRKAAASKDVRKESAREVIDKSKKIAALSAVLQSEEALQLLTALKSEDAEAVFAALKSNGAEAVAAALRAKDVTALAAALRCRATPAESGRPPPATTAEATAGGSSSRPAVMATRAPATSGGTSDEPISLKYSRALVASMKTEDRDALLAAFRSRDVKAVGAILRSERVASLIAYLKEKQRAELSKGVTSAASIPPTSEGVPVVPTVARPAAAAAAPVADTRKPGGAAARFSTAAPGDTSVAVSIRSGNRAAVMAALSSRNAAALVSALKSRNPLASSAGLRPGVMPISPKSKAIAARWLALESKVATAVRTKSAAAKAAAAKLKVATTTLAARKAKKRVHCQEPVLCVFESDVRCPWHFVYVPSSRHATEGKAGGVGVPKEEVKTLKEEAGDDHETVCFGPVKKMKMELEELTPNIDGIVGDVEIKMEANDEAADDMASVSGSGRQADQSTESTLSATSPRADDDYMDDDCRDMDVDMDTGAEEVMLQPPPGADDADLVAVAQGVAMVGAEEEVAVIQQDDDDDDDDDDSLTNPPNAVDEVEVS